MDTNFKNNIENEKKEIMKEEIIEEDKEKNSKNEKNKINKKEENTVEINEVENTKRKNKINKSKNKNNKNKEVKEKNKGKVTRSAFFTVIFILIFSIIAVGSYAPIKDKIFENKNNTKAYIESDDFIYSLTRLTRYLKEAKLQDSNWYDYRYENLQSIKYYVGYSDKSQSVSNITDFTEGALQEEINNSQFYLHVKIDENRDSQIESSLGEKFDKGAFIDRLDLWNEDENQYANLDIIYTIPKNLDNYNDSFIYNMNYYNIVPYLILILAIGAVSSLILIIIAFSISYNRQKRISICRLYNKMFLELKLLLWLGFPGLCVGGAGLIDMNYGNRYNEVFNVIDAIYNVNSYFYLIGIPITFILFILIYLSIVYIKYIYYSGFIEGFIKNSIAGKIFFYVIIRLKNSFEKICKQIKQITQIDITRDDNKKVVIILGINLIALWIIALAGPFGLILAIAYTIYLGEYLLKFIVKVSVLNNATNNISQGKFDTILNENIGILSPIAKNLNNIKAGFKVAMDKEIKSQQMKTELISNVSHDLRTPLTSIINYVDLLKNEDITIETKKEYIDILDRKSKRLKVLIEDLFEASKATSGNVELHLEKVDVVSLLRQTLGELEEKINNSTLQIKFNAPENKVICELDGRRTYRIFENIMSNIFKYSMPSSRVYIDVLEGEKEVSLIFKNISSYEMNFDTTQITDRFARGDKSRNTEGSGLGLAIAKSLIELQNGSLTISIDGDLFKVIITFPKVEKNELQ